MVYTVLVAFAVRCLDACLGIKWLSLLVGFEEFELFGGVLIGCLIRSARAAVGITGITLLSMVNLWESVWYNVFNCAIHVLLYYGKITIMVKPI